MSINFRFPTISAKSDKSGLPFTGLDVGIVVLAGGFLVGTGLVIRRASRGS